MSPPAYESLDRSEDVAETPRGLAREVKYNDNTARRPILWALTFAGVAAAALLGVALAPRRTSRTFERPRTEVVLMEAARPHGPVAPDVAQAEAAVQRVDSLKAKSAADKARYHKLHDQATRELKHAKSQVKTANDALDEASDRTAKAREIEKRAKAEMAKAREMLREANDKREHGLNLRDAGTRNVADSHELARTAQKVKASFAAETQNAQTAVDQEVQALTKEAAYLKGKSATDKKAADVLFEAASGKFNATSEKDEAATKRFDDASDRLSSAQHMQRDAKQAIADAHSDTAHAKQEEKNGLAGRHQGKADVAAGERAVAGAKDAAAGVGVALAKVRQLETKALRESASHRACVDLPGARLHEVSGAEDFEPVIVKKEVGTSAACAAWCRQHEGCAQAIFSVGNSGCYLFRKATTLVKEWGPMFNSSICGDAKEKPKLLDMVKVVYAQKPDLPAITECSWDGEDCSGTKCCNNVGCTWDQKTCKPFSCYQQPGGGAQCLPTESWSVGQIIGGGHVPAVVKKSAKEVTPHGTTIFCFMVVDWKSPEGALGNHIKEKKLSVYQCDAHAILTGWQVPKTPWATYINADAFSKHWETIRKQGVYKKYDWTVKVEPDVVFFPGIFRMHLDALRVPQGAAVYISNMNYKFKFQGALEAFTREAVQLYFDKGGACKAKLLKVNPKAGEDFMMKACMDSVGAATVEDFSLVRDSTCGDDCGAVKGPCANAWTAAYHSYKEPKAWDGCHGEAAAAQKAKGLKPSGPAPPPEAKAAELLPTGGDEAASAGGHLREAARLKAKTGPDAANAKALRQDADKQLHEAEAALRQARKQIAEARADQGHDADVVREAKENGTAAAAVVAEQSGKVTDYRAVKDAWDKKYAAAKDQLAAAQRAEDGAAAERAKALAAEHKELSEVASQRVCLDLPGVRLNGGKKLDLPPIVLEYDVHTPELCRDWCREHSECQQSIFSQGNKGCYLFAEQSGQPAEFKDTFNSTYCGGWSDNQRMLDALHKVFKMKPYVPPIRKCSWAGEDCSQTKCCANVPVPNWKFTKFSYYTCYRRDPSFSGCHLGAAPGSWSGEILGSAGTREVPKAPKGVLTQGTSLFCFAVVCWNKPSTKAFWDSEAMLANNIKKTGRSIYACDAHAFFDGGNLNGGGDGSSINNIDAFINAWNHVRDDGRYLQHDWTIKVDSDAVFFPDRLKAHLYDLRTPQGSRVYLKNINFKFQFLGAIEVFSKEALETLFQEIGTCAGKVGHQGGEDYYMESCMDGIGIDHQTDFKLLNDKYAATGNCNDPWVVAFHFYKKVSSWNACHDAAVKSAQGANMQFRKLEQ